MPLTFAIEGKNPQTLLPKFSRRVLAARLKVLGTRGRKAATAPVEAKAAVWSDTEIRATLEVGNIVLARLDLKINNELTFEHCTDRLEDSPAFYAALWGSESTTSNLPGEDQHHLRSLPYTITRYSNLNPFCEVSQYYLHGIGRGEGVGTAWYQTRFEPFLVESGVEIVAVRGTCAQLNRNAFWKRMGYEWVTDDFHGDTLYGLNYKILT